MAKCECGHTIIWATDEKGTKHPLDAVAPVYEHVSNDGNNVTVRRRSMAWVSHFATCRLANKFSKGKKSDGKE